MTAPIQWDSCKTVEDALKPNQFVVVCFAHTWNPPSVHVASILQKFRDTGEFPWVQIFIINAEKDVSKCFSIGVTTTPVIMLYYHNQPLIIRRPMWDDEPKFVGSTTKDNLSDIIRAARDTIDRGQRIISLDF